MFTHTYGVKPLEDAVPGDCFLFVDEHEQWAIWQMLDGDTLHTANELGYKGWVIACILVGEVGGLPRNPKTDETDLPWAMQPLSEAIVRFDGAPCEYLGPLG